MPYNGSGTFVRAYNWVNDANSSIPITASRMDADSNDFASGLSNCVTRDGQGLFTSTINGNNQLMTNVNVGSAATPGLTFQGLGSTGLFSPAAGGIALSAAGVSVVVAVGAGGVPRLQADFSNATVVNRTYLQTSATNTSTTVGAAPNGSGAQAAFLAVNNSTPTNCAWGAIGANATAAFVNSGVNGSGTQLPLQFQINGTSYGQLTTAGIWSFNAAAFTPTVVLTYGTTTTVNCALSNAFRVVFGAGNITTLTMSNPSDGQSLSIRFKQDATGSRTIAWPASFRWNGGLAPVLSTAANAIDMLTAQYDGTDSTFVCSLLKGVQ